MAYLLLLFKDETHKKFTANAFNLLLGKERISTKIITGVLSRAAAIVKEARQENYDTIVLGRRGLTQVQTFFIGRVTNKVIHMARERTVWVVR